MDKQYADKQLTQILQDVKTIAIIGLSPKPNRPSHSVAKRLQSFCYTIVPVRPAINELLGEKAYNSLEDIPFKVDLVNVFRASKYVDEIVAKCIELEINKIWLQEGVVDYGAEKKALDAGISIIMDRCIYKEILRLDISHINTQ